MNAHNCSHHRLCMEDQSFIPLSWTEVPLEEMHLRSKELLEVMHKRRTTRHFSTREVPKELIERAILCGGTAPSGAHLQPWTFVAISSQELKQKIREAAEAEERKTYQDRMPDAWREVLQPLGTDASQRASYGCTMGCRSLPSIETVATEWRMGANLLQQ